MDLIDKGFNRAEVAKQMGMPHSTVRHVVRLTSALEADGRKTTTTKLEHLVHKYDSIAIEKSADDKRYMVVIDDEVVASACVLSRAIQSAYERAVIRDAKTVE